MVQNITSSPIHKIKYKNREFLIKRDDLLHKDFSGNKARKFWYFFINDFKNIKKVVSYGSNQSNAMYSLSVLAKLKGWRFEYYVDHIPSYLKENPQGNYKYALQNGMNIIENNNFSKDNFINCKDTLFIDEGGAIAEAQYGLEQLSCEIKEYKINNNIKSLKIFLPSGTGTTALFLQKYIDDEVLTTPCVGDGEYLQKQFAQLVSNKQFYPTILNPKKKYHFGKLYRENYLLYLDLKKETNIEFDLLYDPIGWDTLLYHLDSFSKDDTILYIHQGGLIGNESMIQRYLHKYSF